MKKPFVSGEQFKKARLRFNLTQVQAGELCGVHWTTIQRWESGRTQRVRRVYLEKLREA